MQHAWQSIFIKVLACWVLLTTSLVTLATWKSPSMHAVICMGWGVILFWITIGGILMFHFREAIRKAVLQIALKWQVKFVLFCTVLALLEEAVTTTMTNLAPLFGVKIGQAYITASANYLDVVALHSVVMFVPLFIGWAVILSWLRFSPFAVFVLFGLTGTIMETKFFTYQGLMFGFWIFIYGLMIYLPAYCLPERNVRRPSWWLYPLVIVGVFPFIFLLAPIYVAIGLLFPGHPHIHFPPIAG